MAREGRGTADSSGAPGDWQPSASRAITANRPRDALTGRPQSVASISLLEVGYQDISRLLQNGSSRCPFLRSPDSMQSDFPTHNRCFDRSRHLRQQAHDVIPGGCHTYAKGDDQFPWLAPGFIAKGAGCRVWDVDGNEYIEYGSGLRAVTLGHAFAPILEAVQRELQHGVNFTRPAPIEVACAEQLRSMIPGAEMVKFAKDGSTATNAALRLARAHTGRDLVGICADHPFFSTADWFIGTTEVDAGIPASTKAHIKSFRYNDLDSARELFDKYPDQIAALILEPMKNEPPHDGFLHRLQDLCHEHGAVFILDEMITGFRFHNGGGQGLFGIEADLSTFGKGMANGFAVSALAGKRGIMELGGLLHDKERVFLMSTTHGAETHALAAALATMKYYQAHPVVDTLRSRGEFLQERLTALIHEHELQDFVQVTGHPACLVFATRDNNRQPSQAFRALLLQETIQRGVLMPSLVVNYSHQETDLLQTVDAWREPLEIYQQALINGIEKYLVGRPTDVVYRRYNGPGPWVPSDGTDKPTATPPKPLPH